MTKVFHFDNAEDRNKVGVFLLTTLPADEQCKFSVVGFDNEDNEIYIVAAFSSFVANEVILFCISTGIYCEQVIDYLCEGADQYDESKLTTELLCYGTYLTDFNTHDALPKYLSDAHRVSVIKHDITGDIYWVHRYNGDVVELKLLK